MFKQTINILKVNMLASTLHGRGYAFFGIPALHGKFSGTFCLMVGLIAKPHSRLFSRD